MSRMLRLISPLLLGALGLSQTGKSNSKEPTELKLQKCLLKFAQQNSLTESELINPSANKGGKYRRFEN